MDVLISAGIVLLMLLGTSMYVVVNVVLANWANYSWSSEEFMEEE